MIQALSKNGNFVLMLRQLSLKNPHLLRVNWGFFAQSSSPGVKISHFWTASRGGFFWVLWWILVSGSGCSGVRPMPCTLGGQPVRERDRDRVEKFEGTKRCYQMTTRDGRILNHGKYFEWYSNEKIAVTGEYKEGVKNGRWVEYDNDGNKVSDQIFEDGKIIYP